MPIDGRHPVLDRDDVHDIYAEWRAVFNEYDPPRTAVAEAWVDRARRPRYASAEGLGQAFNFDLLEADFDAAQFRSIVADNLDLATTSGSSSTWVLSNHDVVRHATRYGLPASRARCERATDAQARQRVAAVGRRDRRLSTARRERAGPARQRSSCWDCRVRHTSTRARSSDSTRLPNSTTPTGRIRRTSAAPVPTWGETDAACRCPGEQPGTRSASARTARICRSRSGSRDSPSSGRSRIPTRCCRSTGGLSSSETGSMAARRSSGSTAAGTTCSGTGGPADGRSSRTSAQSPSRSISPMRCWQARRRTDGTLAAASSVWLQRNPLD